MTMVRGCVRVLTFFLLGLFLACTYTNDKKYYNPISPPPQQIKLVIDIESPQFTDPYLLDWPTTFSINIQKTGKKLTSFAVKIDNATSNLGTYQNGILQLPLSPTSFSNGAHEVNIQLYFDSQTNSLADAEGKEHYLVEKRFTVIVDSSLPPPSVPIQPKIENGYLTFRWNLGTDHQFSYHILKSIGTSINTLTNVGADDFKGKGNIVYIDSGYVGGFAVYSLFISNYFNTYGSNIAQVTVHFPPAQFQLQTGAGNSKSLTWNPIIKDANVTVIGPKKTVTVPISQGKVDLDTAALGDQSGYRILINRNLRPKQAFDSSFAVGTPKNLPAFGDLRIMPQQSKLFIWGGQLNNLVRYSLPDFTKEDDIMSHNIYLGYYVYPQFFDISADGSRADLGVGGAVILKIDPLDFSQHSNFVVEKQWPNQSYYVISTVNSISPPSSAGLQGVNYGWNGSGYAAVVDLTVDTNIHQLDGIVWMDSVNRDTPIVSEDSQFFCVNSPDQSANLIYKKIGTNWTMVGKTSVGSKFFRGHGTSELIVNIGSTIQVFDVSAASGGNLLQPVRTFSFANSISNQSPTQVGYDNATQNIFVETIDHYNYSTIKLFDVADFSYKGQAVAYAPYPIRHIYSNNYHFLTSGFGEKLQP